MSSALANRFCHIEVGSNSASWLDWAIVNNIDPRVTAFIRYMPQKLFSMEGNKERGWPSPRSWERVAMELELGTKNGLDDDLMHVIVEGLVGEGAALEFMAFLQWSEKIPDIGKMLSGDIRVKIPKRPDQKYAMISAIVHHIRQHEQPENLLNGFFDIITEFSNDWAQLLHHDISLLFRSNLDFFETFREHPQYATMANKIVIA